jgi:hypothetical protein
MTIRWTPEMDAALRALRAEGRGQNYIGVRIGVAGEVVARRIKQLGLPVWARGGGHRQTGPRLPRKQN